VKDQTQPKPKPVRVAVEPGICGFPCVIEAIREENYEVSIRITGAECKHIKRLSEQIGQMSMRDLFKPMTRNPIYSAAQRAGCHPSCPIPMAVLKAVEVAMEMALPCDVTIRFES
jgi:hypothetical protein